MSALECPSCGASLSWVATGGGTITGTVRATCRRCGVKLGITFHGSVDNVTISVPPAETSEGVEISGGEEGSGSMFLQGIEIVASGVSKFPSLVLWKRKKT